MDYSSIVEKLGRSIVRIEGRHGRTQSGVVWTDRRIVTVARRAPSEGTLSVGVDGKVVQARIKGSDASTDLLLLEVDEPLTVPTFEGLENVKVGQPALLVARPGETVRATAGIISVRSSKSWRSPAGGELSAYLETDATYEHGFSGGALVSDSGNIRGIVSVGLLHRRSIVIPVPTVKRVLDQLETHGRVRRSFLGLSLQPLKLPEDVKAATGEEIGLLIVGVQKGGPGDQAGIRFGDTLLHLGDDSVATLDDLFAYLRADHVGETVPAQVFRNGKTDVVNVTLGAG